MGYVEYLERNKEKTLLPIFALLSFTTWSLKIPQVYNIVFYIIVLGILIYFKFSNLTLIMFSIFGLMSNYEARYQFSYQALFAVLTIYFIIILIVKKPQLKGKLIIPIMLFALYSAISLIWTNNHWKGLIELAIIYQGYVAYLAIRNSDNKTTFYQLSWFLTMVALVIGVQYLIVSYDMLPGVTDNKYSWDLWQNPNIVASLLGIVWAPSLYKYFAKETTKKTFFYLPFEAIFIYAIIISSTRGLQFGSLMAVVFALFMIVTRSKKATYILFNTLIVLFVVATIGLTMYKDALGDLYTKINKTSSGRLTLYEIALEQLKNPLVVIFGQGSGSSKDLLSQQYHNNSMYYHSWFYQIVVTKGLIGLVLSQYLMYKIYQVLDKNNRFTFFAVLGIIVHLFHHLLDVGYEYQFLSVCLYIYVALIEKNSTIEISNGEDVKTIEEGNNII